MGITLHAICILCCMSYWTKITHGSFLTCSFFNFGYRDMRVSIQYFAYAPPPAKQSRSSSTDMRVPATRGLPASTPEFVTIRPLQMFCILVRLPVFTSFKCSRLACFSGCRYVETNRCRGTLCSPWIPACAGKTAKFSMHATDMRLIGRV